MQLIAGIVDWADPATYLTILKVVVGLGLVIFVHELGHFLVAKACGVKCEKFYVGFDPPIKIGPLRLPRTLCKFKWGETEYGVGIIPLGGYVKMLGQDDNPAKAAEEIERAKVYKKKLKEGKADEVPLPPKDHPAGSETIAEQKSTEEKDIEQKGGEEKGSENGEDKYVFDPRSYQAKSVPQRMAIISAGVIMNLIFAVIFATIAYSIGVKYKPCIVGSTSPSSPCWQYPLQPGDKIIQIGRDGNKSEHLRFQSDMMQSVVINGDDQDMDFLVRHANGSEEWVTLRPTKEIGRMRGNYADIGFLPATQPILASEDPVLPHLAAAKAKMFKGDDRIIALDGKPIEHTWEMREYFAKHPDKTVTVTVERKDSPTPVDIPVEPNPMRRLGLAMKIDCIAAVQGKSPAAGKLKPGDLIEMIDFGSGLEPVGDPLTLPERLRLVAADDKSVTIQIRRVTDGRPEILKVALKPRLPASSPVVTPGDPIAIDELGVAFQVLNWVAGVEPGSPAEKAGIKAGDKIIQVDYAVDEKLKKQYDELDEPLRPIDLREQDTVWPAVDNSIQIMLPGTKLTIAYVRNGQNNKALELEPVEDSKYNLRTRGIHLTELTDQHQADSLGEAFGLGLRQTKEDSTRVFSFLKKLVSGAISPTNLGGPATIAVVATSEATQGTARLLLFLTLLSANLAIVNFLPIPVLDGGHMVFLLWEGIRGKPPSEKVFMGLTLVGFAFILGLMLFVIGLDVFRIANWVSG